MGKRVGALLLLCLLLAASAQAGVRRKIVVFTAGQDATRSVAVLRGVGGRVGKALPLINGVAVSLSDAAAATLARRPDVLRIEDDALVQAHQGARISAGKPKPPEVNRQQTNEAVPWGITWVQAPTAWQCTVGAGVKVGILDTGIVLTHPDLAANIAGGVNCINPTKSVNDDNGHGTHVAGTVAAVHNTFGVVGVAPAAKLYAVKVLGRDGSGNVSDIIEGLTWCIDNGMQVVNMSLGLSTDVQSLHDAVIAARHAGLVVVCSAGNNNSRGGIVDYPARYPEVIAVSAVGSDYRLASFSSYGSAVDVCAPGVNISSTYLSSKYTTLSGTSMATPHVTGVVALRLALRPGEAPDAIAALLQSTATDLGAAGWDQFYGAGLVNASAMVAAP